MSLVVCIFVVIHEGIVQTKQDIGYGIPVEVQGIAVSRTAGDGIGHFVEVIQVDMADAGCQFKASSLASLVYGRESGT